MKFKAGDKFPLISVTTATGKELALPVAGVRYTHVQFRRFSGCPICNVHIASLRQSKDRLIEAGIHEVLFFHSNKEDISSYHNDLPFDAVADPEKRYYRQFGIESSWGYAMNLRALWAAVRGMGGKFGLKSNGGKTGLPADFLVAPDGVIKAVKYGRHAYDQWSVKEILELAKDTTV